MADRDVQELASALSSGAQPASQEPANQQVADEQAASVASEESQQVAEDGEQPASPDDLTQDERFRAWQSKYDKRLAELEKENTQLKAKVEGQTGPTNAEKRKQEELASEWQRLNIALQEEDDPTALRDLSMRFANVQRDMMDTDTVIAAKNAGIDPDDKEYRSAVRDGQIESYHQLEALAYRIRANQLQSQMASTQSKPADKQAKDPRVEMAKTRQELGMNAVPSTAPRGQVSPATEQERQWQAAKESKDMMAALGVLSSRTQQ